VKVIIFGSTGMVGQGALRECLLDSRVTKVTCVVRSATGQRHDKLTELVRADLYDWSGVDLSGHDVCLFCLGVSAGGMSEADYTRVTYELTLAAAKALLAQNEGMTFEYVSGAGTDSSEKGRAMWARVKGRTENALLAMGFKAAYMLRPGAIQPMHGIKSKTAAYRILYTVMWPVMPLLKAAGAALSTESLGRAMLNLAEKGYEKRVLEMADLKKVARG